MRPSRTRGILWDLDGVLVDTGEFHYQAWAETLASLHISYSRELFQATFGMNNLDTLGHLLGRPPTPDRLAQVNHEKEERFRTAIQGQARPLPGVVGWIEHLKAMGMRQAIASSAPQANIDALVDALDLRRHFDAILSGADMPGKPDPAVFLEAARHELHARARACGDYGRPAARHERPPPNPERGDPQGPFGERGHARARACGDYGRPTARRLDLPPEACVVIEDSVAGVRGAKRAGMRCVAITTTNPREALAEADLIVAQFGELPEAVFR